MTILIDNVSVRFGDVSVLEGLSLDLRERRIGIIGNNGSGKSTLARLLNGLVLPSAGRVVVEAFDTRTHGADVRKLVGFVFQNADAQIVMPTVAEDVAFGPKAHGLAPQDVAARTEKVLAQFNLAALKDRACFNLSGGEKQSLALAGVLALDPRWVVFDEPTTMLDRKRAKTAMNAITALPQHVIVVTHHVELLEGFERVIVLEAGKVVCDASPREAIAHYLDTYI
ncbi:MAG: ABC transporter ATP-binding protein [Rhodospirillaceae bacterium]|nr:ABC transporter ATP-binding protein [Rhodospirillaceae bacterium]